MTVPNRPARPASTPAIASSTTTARVGSDLQARRGLQERIGRWLPVEGQPNDVHSVHPRIEKIGNAGCLHDRRAIDAGRHDRRFDFLRPKHPYEVDGGGISLDAMLVRCCMK